MGFGAQGSLYRSLVPEGSTPAAKGIDAGWLASLRLREAAEPEATQDRNELRYIGMPVGGIGCGALYLGGDGRLWLWDIMYAAGSGIRPRSRTLNGTSHNCASGCNYFAPIDAFNPSPPADETPRPFEQGFALRTVQDGDERIHLLDRTGFASIAFRGNYPMATVAYADPTCPLEVELTAYSPFIPLHPSDSALPSTILEYRLRNASPSAVDATLLGWLENPVFRLNGVPAGAARINALRTGDGFGFLECSAGAVDIMFEDFEKTGYAGWTVEGTAFGSGPVLVADIPPYQGDIDGQGERVANSHASAPGTTPEERDAQTGRLTSDPFMVSRAFIHFLLGGGHHPGTTEMRLIDADTSEVLRAETGDDSYQMTWRSWSVADLLGRQVRIVIDDQETGTWGNIGVDQIVFSDLATPPVYILFEDFEQADYAGWSVEGVAFGSGPIRIADIPSYQGNVNGVGERVVNSHASAPGTGVNGVGSKDGQIGRLTSDPFTIEQPYILFLLGGGNHPGFTEMRLVDAASAEVLRSTTGNNNNAMTWRSWDVSDLAGRQARLVILDNWPEPGATPYNDGWGNVGVDQILFSNRQGPTSASGAAIDTSRADCGTIGLAELGPTEGRVGAPSGVSAAFPWLPAKPAMAGGIGRAVTLQPGEETTLRFVLAWHFANVPVDPATLPTRREYANRFADAWSVAGYIVGNYARLSGDTRAWVGVWKDSTLPRWLLDRALATTATLATTNCFWFDTGRFYGTEGVGCCAGTCAHVWYYAQSMAFLFPSFERSLRQNVDLNSAVSLRADGSVRFRGEYNNDWAWDGQAGVVLRCYREHRMSADASFLSANWANIKRVLQFLVGEDGNNDGVSEARQHDTLDADWYGRVPAHIGLYAAALRAGQRMASEIGDTAFAAGCDAIAAAASARMAERFVSDPDYGEGYYVHLLTGTNGQLGHAQGCHIDQVIGELYARLLGLGRVTDAAQCRAALRSVWRFNYSRDLAGFLAAGEIRQGRPYQLPGEAGTLICTFPNDGNIWSASWQSGYFAECMTGFEYQVAAHCLAEGLIDEGLTMLRAVYDRYRPLKRNPFNEIECSDHYARAMSSYAAFLAVCGFEHDGPNRHIGFAPKLHPRAFRAAFTSAEGWGSIAQARDYVSQRNRIDVAWGRLRVRTFATEAPAHASIGSVVSRVNGSAVPSAHTWADGRLRVTLVEEQEIVAGGSLEIEFRCVADADADGMPDDFEDDHGFDKEDGADAAQDADGDRQGNTEEFTAGTDPRDAGSVLAVTQVKPGPSGVEVTWSSVPDRTYDLQVSDLQAPDSWQTSATNLPSSADGTSTGIDTEMGEQPSRSYRVSVRPP
jgi:uncharacterized protein (DUF608 family)